MLTRPDAPSGRGRQLQPSPVAEHAAAHGIEVLKPPTPSDPEFLERLRAIDPACCPIVAYGALLRREALDIPEFGWVNLHFSVLPAWRGAAPVQRAIMAGDEVTGATVFSLVEELDAGPVARHDHRAHPRRRHRRDAARPAGPTRGRPAGRRPRPHRGRRHRRSPAAGGRHLLRGQAHHRRRPCRLEPARVRGRPADPRMHARARAWAMLGDERLKLGPVTRRRGVCARQSRARAGTARHRQARGAGGHGDVRRGARRRAAVRPQAHAAPPTGPVAPRSRAYPEFS